jgi:hypothetical protein
MKPPKKIKELKTEIIAPVGSISKESVAIFIENKKIYILYRL